MQIDWFDSFSFVPFRVNAFYSNLLCAIWKNVTAASIKENYDKIKAEATHLLKTEYKKIEAKYPMAEKKEDKISDDEPNRQQAVSM